MDANDKSKDDRRFEERLSETITWGAPRAALSDVKRSLRSEDLRPWVLAPHRHWAVEDVVRRRSSLLSGLKASRIHSETNAFELTRLPVMSIGLETIEWPGIWAVRPAWTASGRVGTSPPASAIASDRIAPAAPEILNIAQLLPPILSPMV